LIRKKAMPRDETAQEISRNARYKGNKRQRQGKDMFGRDTLEKDTCLDEEACQLIL
jgi:hypothetical protein